MSRLRELCSVIARQDIALLLVVVVSCLILNIGFFFGLPCAGWYLWASVSIVGGMMGFVSRRKGVVFLLVTGALLVTTLYAFTYQTSDSQRCHAVVQRFLVAGWNPVLQNTPDRLSDISCYDVGGVSFNHILYLPKLTGYMGAVVAKAMGLWLGDAFLGNLIALVLVLTAVRFCKYQWNVVGWRAWVFAAFVFNPTHYISVFTGQSVDYVVYATIVALVLACGNWWQTRSTGDLTVVLLSGVLALSAKASAYALVVLTFVGILLTVGRRNVLVRRWMLFAIASLIVLMASPVLTSWITMGSPFYPSHSFDPSRKVLELCADMTGNEDALKMGYLARIVYAWVSKSLAVAGCAWWYDKSDFSPLFNVPVEGKGVAFTILLVISILCLISSRRSKVWLLWGMLAVSCLLFPKRYIGYPRYVPQVWVLPVLAFYQFAFTLDWGRIGRVVRVVLPICLLGYVLPFYARTGLNYWREMTLERIRQARLTLLAGQDGPFYIATGTRYWLYRDRARLAGVALRKDDVGVGLHVDEEYVFYSTDDIAQLKFLPAGTFPQFNGLSDFRSNPWREYGLTILHPPRPLWDRD